MALSAAGIGALGAQFCIVRAKIALYMYYPVLEAPCLAYSIFSFPFHPVQ